MSELKKGAVVVLFYPESNIYDKLKFYSDSVDILVIYDNTPSHEHSEFVRLECKKRDINNCVIISEGKNIGIATALNVSIKACIDNACEEIFLFDQDSLPSARNYFESMSEELWGLNFQDKAIVSLVPDIRDEANPDVDYMWLARSERRTLLFKRRSLKDDWDRSVLVAITSGTLIYSSVFREIGLFRDEYFIDYVDTEYCLRMINSGFKIAASVSSVLLHNLGAREENSFFGKKIYPTNHSAIRRYYIARNSVDMWCRYSLRNPDWAFFDLIASFFNAFRICFFEKGRMQKIKFCMLGFFHGILGRMGEK